MNEIVKTCKIHGELTLENTRRDGKNLRCKKCRSETNKKTYYTHREKRVATSVRWKQQNRGDYNQWCKNDRKKNPEKYRKYEENYIKKHGIEKLRKYEIARIHGLTIDQYDELLKNQDNLCSICNKKETRKGRDGKTLTPLCIDHCHSCEDNGKYIIRGLLCHDCNTGIGKFKDSIELLEKAIHYLKKHNHV